MLLTNFRKSSPWEVFPKMLTVLSYLKGHTEITPYSGNRLTRDKSATWIVIMSPPLVIKAPGDQSHLWLPALLALLTWHQPETWAEAAGPSPASLACGGLSQSTGLITTASVMRRQLTWRAAPHTYRILRLVKSSLIRELWPQTKNKCRQASFKFCFFKGLPYLICTQLL